MSVFASPTLASAIGFALVEFLWQGAAIGAAIALTLRALRRSSPQARYVTACAGLVVMSLAPIVTVARHVDRHRHESGTPIHEAALVDADTSMASASDPHLFLDTLNAVARWLEPQFPRITLMWMGGVLVLMLRIASDWLHLRQVRVGATALRMPWSDTASRIGASLVAGRAFAVVESTLMRMPAVVGWFKPVIVMPASVLAGLSPAYVEAILAHEIAHVRRADHLVNAAQCVIETLLFYHPAVWWVSRQIRQERELCCDHVALSICDPISYASALTRLEELQAPTALATAATGGDLLDRIRRLVAPQPSSRPTASGGLVMCVSFGIVVLSLSGQLVGMSTGSGVNQIDVLPVPSTPVAPALLRASLNTATPVVGPQQGTPATADARIMGEVVGADGRAVSGARIEVAMPTPPAPVLITGAEGRFALDKLVAGTYDLTVSASGFKTVTVRVQASGNTTASVRVQLNELPSAGSQTAAPSRDQTLLVISLLDRAQTLYGQGRAAEARQLTNQALRTMSTPPPPPPPPGSSSSGAASVRVGGGVASPTKIRHVPPVYPVDARTNGFEGIVILEAMIDEQGVVTDAKVLRSRPGLDDAALDAVRQWRYTPTLLNGMPVSVIMTTTVNFSLNP